MQTPADQEGMPAHEVDEPVNFRFILERIGIPLVEFGDVGFGKILQNQSCADVEWRLVHVRDEQVRLGGISDREGQAGPGSGRVERPFIVPGAEQAEDLAAVRAEEESIDFIQTPHQRSVEFGQHFPADEPFKIDVGAPAFVPHVSGHGGEFHLIRQRLGEAEVKIADVLQVDIVELLEVGQGDLGSPFPGRLQPACQKGCLADLPSAFDEDDAVVTADGVAEFGIDGACDVKFGIQRDGSTDWFQRQVWEFRAQRVRVSMSVEPDGALSRAPHERARRVPRRSSGQRRAW